MTNNKNCSVNFWNDQEEGYVNEEEMVHCDWRRKCGCNINIFCKSGCKVFVKCDNDCPFPCNDDCGCGCSN